MLLCHLFNALLYRYSTSVGGELMKDRTPRRASA